MSAPQSAPVYTCWALATLPGTTPILLWHAKGSKCPALYTSKLRAEQALKTTAHPNMGAYYVPVLVGISVIS